MKAMVTDSNRRRTDLASTEGRYDLAASLRSLLLAIAGFVLVLALGFLVGRLIGSDEGFADLGVYAVTAVFFAPLGAVIGSLIGARRSGTARPRAIAIGVLVALTVVALVATRSPYSVTGGLAAIALANVVYAGLKRGN